MGKKKENSRKYETRHKEMQQNNKRILTREKNSEKIPVSRFIPKQRTKPKNRLKETNY